MPRDLVTVAQDGVDVPLHAAAQLRGTVTLSTPFGSTTLNLDTDAASNPLLAALTLANAARHPDVGENRNERTRAVAAALRHADTEAVRSLSADAGATLAWFRSAPTAFALRALRENPETRHAMLARPLHAHPGQVTGQLVELVASLSGDADHAGGHGTSLLHKAWTGRGEKIRLGAASRAAAATNDELQRMRGNEATAEKIRRGLPVPLDGTEGNWQIRSALAATRPDLADRLTALHEHPLVRAAAARHRDNALEVLFSDPDPAVRRAAAAAVLTRAGAELGLPPVRGLRRRPDLVCVDVDGTLVDEAGRPDGASVAALAALQADGVPVVLVTTRSVDQVNALALGVDLVCADGVIADLPSGHVLAQATDKGDAVRTLCELFGAQYPLVAGDGRVDIPMFEEARRRGGRAAWLTSGQLPAAAAATDVIGPLGSGPLAVLLTPDGGAVPGRGAGVSPLPAGQVWTGWHVGADAFAAAAAAGVVVPDGWRTADGHVTLAHASSEVPVLPDPAGDVTIVATGVVVTDRSIALAVTVDGQQTTPEGTAFHVTLATGPRGRGHYPPVVAGKDVSTATADQVRPLPPTRLPALPAPVGSGRVPIPTGLLTAAADRPLTALHLERWLLAGADPDVLAEHLDEPFPLARALAVAGKDLPDRGLVVLVGPPASGKSTMAARLTSAGGDVVEWDAIRGELFGDPRIQGNPARVHAVATARAADGLALGRLVVVDATNVQRRTLREQVALAHAAGTPAVLVDVTVPRHVAEQRDRDRHAAGLRAIGDRDGSYDAAAAQAVFDRMYARYQGLGDVAATAATLAFDVAFTAGELPAVLR